MSKNISFRKQIIKAIAVVTLVMTMGLTACSQTNSIDSENVETPNVESSSVETPNDENDKIELKS